MNLNYRNVGTFYSGSFQPVIQNVDNAVSTAYRSMPMKDLTSDGGASFELDRHQYLKAYPPAQPQSIGGGAPPTTQRQAPALGAQQAILAGPATWPQKKWIGGNRDASQITARRRIQQSGAKMGDPSNTQPISFVKGNDVNGIDRALVRVRAGGAANVPPSNARIT